jgi:hypothetical protein
VYMTHKINVIIRKGLQLAEVFGSQICGGFISAKKPLHIRSL